MKRAVRTRAPLAGLTWCVRTWGKREHKPPGRGEGSLRCLPIAALFFFAFLPWGCTSGAEMDLYESARVHWEKKMYGMAAEQYEQFSLAHPDHPKADESLYTAAFIRAYFLQDPSGAVARFLRLPVRYPNSPYRSQAHEHLAEIYASHLNSYPQAAAQYERLIELQGVSGEDLSDLFFRKARCYFLMEDWDSAQRTHERNLQRYPEGQAADRSAYQIGYIHFLQGRHEAAERAMRFFLEAYPESDWAFDGLLHLARAKEEQHQRLDSEALYRQLRERFPERASALENK